MDVRPYGERARLCDVADPADVPGLRAAAEALEQVAQVVPGAQTLLVVARPGTSLSALDRALETLRPLAHAVTDVREVEVPVRYDGPDLDGVAELTGLARKDVIALHEAGSYTVRFCGFTPGFAYLDGLDERLRLPRLDEPRVRVPAGAVGIADEFTGAYPRPSPGGWRLLGTTDLALWDAEREPPALLTPGTRVRFVRR